MPEQVTLRVPQALLQAWRTEQRAGLPSDLTGQILELTDAALEEFETRAAQIRQDEQTAANELMPLLQEATAMGGYVRSAYFQIGGTEPRPYNYPRRRQSFNWVGAIRELERLGIQTQMVVHTHGRGVEVQGYRLMPEGDTNGSVELQEVYRQAGRCINCGIRRQQASSQVRCKFGHFNHDWPPAEQEPSTASTSQA